MDDPGQNRRRLNNQQYSATPGPSSSLEARYPRPQLMSQLQYVQASAAGAFPSVTYGYQGNVSGLAQRMSSQENPYAALLAPFTHNYLTFDGHTPIAPAANNDFGPDLSFSNALPHVYRSAQHTSAGLPFAALSAQPRYPGEPTYGSASTTVSSSYLPYANISAQPRYEGGFAYGSAGTTVAAANHPDINTFEPAYHNASGDSFGEQSPQSPQHIVYEPHGQQSAPTSTGNASYPDNQLQPVPMGRTESAADPSVPGHACGDSIDEVLFCECGKPFKGIQKDRKGNWRRHARRHAEEMWFPCQYCRKPFNRKDNRDAHQRKRSCSGSLMTLGIA